MEAVCVCVSVGIIDNISIPGDLRVIWAARVQVNPVTGTRTTT